MSQENVEVVRQVIGTESLDAAKAGGADAFIERLDSDIEFEEDPSFPEAGTFRGRDIYLRYARDFIAQFEQLVFSVEELIDAGPDKVLVCLHLTGRGKESGAAFDFRPAWLYTVRDGRVVKIRAYLDRGEALGAAGLRE
jgi:ketosteroid isomerase-like protein